MSSHSVLRNLLDHAGVGALQDETAPAGLGASAPTTTDESTGACDRTAVDEASSQFCKLPPSIQSPNESACFSFLDEVERKLIEYVLGGAKLTEPQVLETLMDNLSNADKFRHLLKCPTCMDVILELAKPRDSAQEGEKYAEQELFESLFDKDVGEFQMSILFENTPDNVKLTNLLLATTDLNWMNVISKCGAWHPHSFQQLLSSGKEALARRLVTNAPSDFVRHSTETLLNACLGNCTQFVQECVHAGVWDEYTYHWCLEQGHAALAKTLAKNAPPNVTSVERKRPSKSNDFTQAFVEAKKVYPPEALSKIRRLSLTDIVNIADGAFCECRSLTSLDLSNCHALESIGRRAFCNSRLETLDLGGCTRLTVISENAFYSAPLTTLNLTKCASLVTIGTRAFFHSQMQTLDLSGCLKLRHIQDYAFYNAPLQKIDFTNCLHLALIDNFAFKSYTTTESVDLSACKSITGNVGLFAFGSNAYTIQSGETYSDVGHIISRNGFPWGPNPCVSAAENGNLECLKYAHENGYWWFSDTCRAAAKNGHLECLKYAHENGCPWILNTCRAAAENGHLECLKYAHENGCVWISDTCTAAAENGHLECLKYAHENGCPWDEDTCATAARCGKLECLKYAHENGCPWDEDTCAAAKQNGNLECLKYARENGCPEPTED